MKQLTSGLQRFEQPLLPILRIDDRPIGANCRRDEIPQSYQRRAFLARRAGLVAALRAGLLTCLLAASVGCLAFSLTGATGRLADFFYRRTAL
jgi:hypothetical protein